MNDSIHLAATAADSAVSGPDSLPTPDIAKLIHELKTPLAAIAALAEIMRDERLGPLPDRRYRGYAADIHESAIHAIGVLTSLLEPAPGQNARAPMVFAEVDVAAIVASSVSTFSPLAERGGVRLRLHSRPRLPHLIADRRSLKQILLNLIANAVRFTPPGGEVELSTRYECNTALCIKVADNGDGMSEAELQRALSAGPKKAGRPHRARSGLGLELVRALAAANGGVLEIESARGQGTCATVRFGPDRIVPV
ncbi:MAG TPA: HAMP domain-containing sensor histidine kinase [Hyphomicrobiaceae bacterium]|nr:HAMP domain-containing sensor histidine kinase [Hyphomicrobiaceae bacterium]